MLSSAWSACPGNTVPKFHNIFSKLLNKASLVDMALVTYPMPNCQALYTMYHTWSEGTSAHHPYTAGECQPLFGESCLQPPSPTSTSRSKVVRHTEAPLTFAAGPPVTSPAYSTAAQAGRPARRVTQLSWILHVLCSPASHSLHHNQTNMPICSAPHGRRQACVPAWNR
jgi:hypothetical protein